MSSSSKIEGTVKYRQRDALSCEQIAEMCEDLDQKDLNLSTTATTTTTTTTTSTTTTTTTTKPKSKTRGVGLSRLGPSKNK